jgi:uncharacterized OB-fold protein
MADASRPVPQPDDVTRPFWDACRRRLLCFQRCVVCGHRWLPASVVCPRCWSAETEWVPASGDGTVFSFAVYRRAYHPAFEALLPYVVAVIELAEGPRLLSNVIGGAPEGVHVGMEVRLDFIEVGAAVLPVFRRTEGGH